jgi:hypothetical protein
VRPQPVAHGCDLGADDLDIARFERIPSRCGDIDMRFGGPRRERRRSLFRLLPAPPPYRSQAKNETGKGADQWSEPGDAFR